MGVFNLCIGTSSNPPHLAFMRNKPTSLSAEIIKIHHFLLEILIENLFFVNINLVSQFSVPGRNGRNDDQEGDERAYPALSVLRRERMSNCLKLSNML